MTKTAATNFPQSDQWSYLWLVLGTVLMGFIYGNWPLGLAGWLAPLFLIRFMRTQRPLRGFVLVVVGLTLANAFAFQRGAGIDMIPLPLFSLFVGIQIGLIFLIDRVLVPRLPAHGLASFAATLVFPMLITAQEFLLFNKFMFGSSGSWAYTQHSNLLLMQVISITGLWGLTFIMTWFASTANWAWERGFSWPEVWRGVAIYGGILALVLAFGSIRLRFFTPEAGTVRVHGFIALEQDPETYLVELEELWETDLVAYRRETTGGYDALIEGTVREAQAGAQIVVWSENAAIGVKEDIEALVVRGQQVAQAENIYLAMGTWQREAENSEYRIQVAAPSGEIVINHLKYAYGQGTPIREVELQTVDTPYGRLSTVLCGDLDNPGVVSQAGRKGVDILLVPALEGLASQAPWHYRLAPFRAVENGFSLMRTTAGGTSIATDPYGRILAFMDYFTADERVIVAQIPTQRAKTVYAAVGDLFGWTSVVGLALIAGWAILRGRQPRRTEAFLPEAPVPAE